ncbi:tegument protein VP11/12-like protein [Phocid alphaherpesvirus 1]|uniref:Tegument protein UL46 homolog n=1 Tax=Phocid alphaherpesvirus 1 TaxID=47418 RepID=A0A482F5F3_9ALPH|nr:tegument protein VP11/12-like protein [Phocid alphaherpesvirus 1]QBN85165.1 tegument protein VP11/12-like protein [Phocid alphaherpesvirus 1]
MSNFISVAANAVSYGPHIKPSVSWIQESKNLLKKRINKGCVLPTPIDVMEAAVVALKENAENLSGPGLFYVGRAIALSSIRNNTVPESVIVNCISKDEDEEYRKVYKKFAKGNIDKLNLSSSALWQVMIKNYWKYLKSSTGVDLVVDIIVNDSKTTQSLTTMLLWSTFSGKRLSKNPFKHKRENSKLEEVLSKLKCCLIKIEKYAYYMRPEDPMAKSEDTKIRLHELLSYTSVCYRWLLWFMDFVDLKVLQKMEKFVSRQGPRETQCPSELFQRHLTGGPGVSSGTGTALVLSEEIYKTLSVMLNISDLWVSSPWNKNIHGLTRAVVSTIEIVSMVHHHHQYLINLVLGGYMCWTDGGMGDPYVISALRYQGRFNCFLGDLVPTIAASTWFNMEKSVCAWFKFALAKSLVGHDTLTAHYLSVLGSIDSPQAPTEERKRVGMRRASSEKSSMRVFDSLFSPPRVPLPSPPLYTSQDTYTKSKQDSPNPYLGMSSMLKSPHRKCDLLKVESIELYGGICNKGLNIESSSSEPETPYTSPDSLNTNVETKFPYANLANVTDEEDVFEYEHNCGSEYLHYQRPSKPGEQRQSSAIQSPGSETDCNRYQRPRRQSSAIQSPGSETDCLTQLTENDVWKINYQNIYIRDKPAKNKPVERITNV